MFIIATPITLTTEAAVQQLRWRYAVKRFDPDKKISAADWSELEQSLVLSPSSFGLQPWKFVIVHDPAVRQQLLSASWNQAQVVDASHLVVFAIRTGCDMEFVDHNLVRMAEVRQQPVSKFDGLRRVIANFLERDQFDVDEWAIRQVYIALGQFMTVCAMTGIDTCPMEGINPARYDEILGLTAEGYQTVVVATAGYRADQDHHATLPKVRFPLDRVISRI